MATPLEAPNTIDQDTPAREPSVDYDKSQFDSLEAYVAHLNELLKDKAPQEIIDFTLATFADKVAMSSSFGIHSSLMIDLVTRANKQIPIIWIDTGYLPQETYQFMDQLTQQKQLQIRAYQSPLTPARMEALYGKLWQSEQPQAQQQYAWLRKVEPMQRAIRELKVQVLLVGLRADQTLHRQKSMNIVNIYDTNKIKICPILNWTKQQAEDYMIKHQLPFHPFKALGYDSVGDAHSSRPLTHQEKQMGNERAGRLHGVGHGECGLHVDLHVTPSLASLHVDNTPTIEKLIRSGSVVILSKPTCKYCLQAKALLRENAKWSDYHDFTVGTEVTVSQVEQIVAKFKNASDSSSFTKTTPKTVPQIFIDGEYVGGFTDLRDGLEGQQEEPHFA